jgi:hypothetical protein
MSASNDEVLRAPCKTISVSIDEINSYLSKIDSKKLKKAKSALKSPNASKRLLYLYLKFGFNGSELAFKNAQRLSENELDDVLMTLNDFPSAMIPISPGRQLTKYLADEKHPDKGDQVWADSTVILFAPWFQGQQGSREGVLFHEVSHILQYQLPKASQRKWNKLSSWVKKGDSWEFDTIDACMISLYSMRDTYEDFAETAAAYRYNARFLKRLCPEKYQFMKDNVFRGVEFQDQSQCSARPFN